jgi:hypothetical protein
MEGNLYDVERKAKLLPNEQCICGSGLRYKECCFDKKIEYKTLGKNYENKEIIFNFTQTSKIYDDISDFLLKEILDKELSVSKGKEYIRYLYNIKEESTKQFSKYASCKKGCSNCCHIYMDCTAIEAELIREYVLKNFNEEQITIFNNKIRKTIESLPSYTDILGSGNENNFIKSYGDKHLPCVFLSEDNSCLIYEVRPFNCRKLISFSEAEACYKGTNIIKPNISIDNIVSYCINQLSMNITRYKKLKTYLENESQEKAIYKSIQHWLINGFSEIDRSL